MLYFSYIDTLILYHINWNEIYLTYFLLKLLGLYLDTLINGHFDNMLSKLTEFSVQKKNAKLLNKFWLLYKRVKYNNNKTANIKFLARAWNCSRDILHRSLMRYLYTTD